MDIADATSTELRQLKRLIDGELDRRRTLETAATRSAELNTAYLAASGVEPGQEWRQPTSAVDAYPEGWVVEHEGRTWVSLTPANVWEPGVSGWREAVEDGEAPEYLPPTGQHDAYNTGDLVTFDGDEYASTIDGNTWSPDAYPQGWEKVE